MLLQICIPRSFTIQLLNISYPLALSISATDQPKNYFLGVRGEAACWYWEMNIQPSPFSHLMAAFHNRCQYGDVVIILSSKNQQHEDLKIPL